MKVQSTEYLVHSKRSMNVEYDNGEEEEKNEEWEKKQEEKNEEVGKGDTQAFNISSLKSHLDQRFSWSK